jgi:hypothetical protein
METNRSASMEIEMAETQEVDAHVIDSEQNDSSATEEELIHANQTVKISEEVEIEDMLKEQNELLSSLLDFEDDSL